MHQMCFTTRHHIFVLGNLCFNNGHQIFVLMNQEMVFAFKFQLANLLSTKEKYLLPLF